MAFFTPHKMHRLAPSAWVKAGIVVSLCCGMLVAGGCSDDASLANVDFEPNPGFDIAGFDITGPDVPDVREEVQADTGPEPQFIPRNAVLPPSSMKDAPGFIVPAQIVAKRSLALSAKYAAWVEVSAKGTPSIITWDLFGDVSPVVRPIANLNNPTNLVVSDTWLAFVDDGVDPEGDLFAMELATGIVTPIAATPRFQRRPALHDNYLVWEDCRNCPPTGARPPSAIYGTLLGGAPVSENLTPGALVNQAPTLGTLADGSIAMAWLQGGLSIRVKSIPGAASSVDKTLTAHDYDSEGVALSGGTLVYRAQPLILNPDSMIPTEPWALNVSTGASTVLATEQNIRAASRSLVVRAGNNFAWLRQTSPNPEDMEIVVVGPTGVEQDVYQAAGATEVTGGGGWLGFVAPRTDNSGESDVWLLPAP